MAVGDVLPGENDAARRRPVQPRDQPRQRRFAAAGLADQPHGLPPLDCEIDPIDRAEHAHRREQAVPRQDEVLLDAAQLEQRFRRRGARRGRRGRRALRRVQHAATLRHPAARGAVLFDRQQFGMLAALLDRERAARAKPAPLRPGARIGRLALDRHQAAVMRLAVEARRRVEQRPGIGVARIAQQVAGRPLLDDLPGIHHQHARADVGDDAEIVADEDDGGAEFRVERPQKLENLRLDRHVQRGGRLVGDQQRGLVRQAHRQHDALAHPAGILVRIGLHGPLRRRHAHAAQQRHGALARSRRGEAAMRGHRFHELLGDAQHGVERGHRVLKDHRDLAAAHVADFVLAEPREVAATKDDAAADDARGLVQQPHDGFRADALARAGLADDAERLAGAEVEADAVHRAYRPGVGQEPGAQVAHPEQRLSGFGHGGRASRAGRRR